jgi:hypothetical protein
MSKPDYKVGYGKPPLHSRFKPGESGYVGGRKKGKKSPSETLDNILAEFMTVSEAGKSKRMTKQEVFLRQLVAHAIASDRQAVKLMLDYLNKRQEQPDDKASSNTDDFLLGELTRMISAQDGAKNEGNDDAAD